MYPFVLAGVMNRHAGYMLQPTLNLILKACVVITFENLRIALYITNRLHDYLSGPGLLCHSDRCRASELPKVVQLNMFQ